MCVVNGFQGRRDIVHDTLKGLGHVVQRAVGEHNGVFEQTVRVHVGEQTRHFVRLVLELGTPEYHLTVKMWL
jgi:hypothetical protein